MNRRTSWTRKVGPAALLAAALLLPASATGLQETKIRAAGTLNVEGRCRILTDDAGHQYALLGDLGSFTTGDRIRVVGTRGEPSRCIEGTTIRVESARADVPPRAARQLAPSVLPAGPPPGDLQVVRVAFRRDDEADASRKNQDRGKGEVSVRGTLTAEGVECQALRDSDGRLYTLTGNLKGFSAGDRVHVVGTRAQASTCQQGITLQVKQIEHAKTQGDEPTAHLENEVLHLIGTLTEDGVACQAFRAEDGTTYTLTGDLKGMKAGDRVGLSGTVVRGSTCQESGTTLQVKTIRRIS